MEKGEEEARQLLMQIQQYQQQAQILAMQRQQLEVHKLEIGSAEEAMKDSKGGEIFRSVGPILIKSDKGDVQKYLDESKEKIEIRLKTVEAQEKKLLDRIKSLSEKLKPFIAGLSG